MSFGQLWIQLQSFAARSLRFVQIVLAAVPVHVKKRTAVRHAGIRTSVVGGNHDGAGEHLPGKVKTLAAKLMEERASSPGIVIRQGILGLLACNRFFFLRRKFDT